VTNSDVSANLLHLCAVLRSFTIDLVSALADEHADIRGKLLASNQFISIDEEQELYRLHDDIYEQVSISLRREHIDHELELHRRVFFYFLNNLNETSANRGPISYEDRLLHHLGEIFLMVASREEWSVISALVADVRASAANRERIAPWLDFYDGFVAIRTQSYQHGMLMLGGLLEQADLDAHLRLQALNALGQAYGLQSMYEPALSLFRRVYELAGDLENTLYQAFALANMSQIYDELGDSSRSLDLQLQSLDLFRALHDRSREAHILAEIGHCSIRLGRWQDAQHYFQAAIDLYQALNNQSGLAYVYWGQGLLHNLFGDADLSEAAYLQALSIARSESHPQPSLAMDTMLFLGFLYQTQQRWVDSLAICQQAASMAAQLQNQHGLSLIDYRRAQVLHRQGQLAEALAAYRAAIDGVEALGGATESEEIKIGLLGTTQQIYEAAVLLLLELGRPDEAFHYVERARSRAFLDALAKQAPDLTAALDRSVCTLADVQAQLPADALLLEYFTTGVLPVGEHMLNSIPASNARLRENLTLPPQTILFAVARDRLEVHRIALDPNNLRPPAGDPYPGRHLLHGRLPQHLYARLIAPAEHLLADRAALYLVPHGPLHYVPFSGLRSAAGEFLVRAGGPALAHAPSATVLLRRCLARPASPAQAALAIGFDDPGGERPLRYAEAEARLIARMLGGEAWDGPAAKSDRLAAAGPQLRWLHIAGHARFNPRDPLGSDLYLGDGDALSARAIIRDLKLSVDLVSLSSCTSGISHVVPGDELLGLQRALLYAGAPTVVCTRWEAYDLVALLVMERFYAGMRQGLPPAAALRDAQLAVRELTLAELGAQAERWRTEAPELAAALAPDLVAPGGSRQLGSAELAAILDSWRGAPDLAAALGQPAPVQPRAETARPFADPLLWAPFMLVGRA
jgi:CHAT domain-containing protein/tetratricopeptide (TPR) repeat protein